MRKAQLLTKHLSEIMSRFTIGYVFISSGIGKLHDIPKVISYFESLKIPFASVQAPMVSGFELIFGLFVLVGFFTRLSSIPLIGIMFVAIITAKADDITSLSDFLSISEFLYIVILIGLAAHGAKSLSIDQWKCARCQPDEIG